MLRSMTGYGRREAVTDGKKILAEIKSVNHRYSDYNIKVQRHLGFLEDRIRKYASTARQSRHICECRKLRYGG